MRGVNPPPDKEKGATSLSPPKASHLSEEHHSQLRFTEIAQVRGKPGEKLEVPADAE